MYQKHEILTTVYFAISANSTFGILIAVTLIPASSVQCLQTLSVLISGIILYKIFLKESISLVSVLCVGLCMCGTTLVVQPDFLFGESSQKHDSISQLDLNSSLNISHFTDSIPEVQTQGNSNIALVTIGYVLSLVSGVMISVEAILLKKKTFIKEHLNVVVFWASLGTGIVSAVVMVGFENPVLPTSWFQLVFVMGQSVCFSVNWLTLFYAAKYISGNTINIVLSTSLVFFLVAQYTVLSSIHPGHRNWMEVVGVVLVLIGSTVKTVLEMILS